ncbi:MULTISPECIES: hypothetical protein [unclassified Microcoleus]
MERTEVRTTNQSAIGLLRWVRSHLERMQVRTTNGNISGDGDRPQ